MTTNHHAASLVARRLDEEWAVMDFWGHLLEEVQLHVTATTLSRTPNITTTKQKKTKAAAAVYQVFGLSGPTLRATPDDLPSIQQAVQREMRLYCNGSTVRKQEPFDGRYSECRVYAVLQHESSLSASSSPLLWIQLNLGRPHDPSIGSWKATTTTASSSSSKPLQFVVAVQPESNLVAVSGARPRWIPCVVAVLEAALTCGGRRYYSNGKGGGWDQHQGETDECNTRYTAGTSFCCCCCCCCCFSHSAMILRFAFFPPRCWRRAVRPSQGSRSVPTVAGGSTHRPLLCIRGRTRCDPGRRAGSIDGIAPGRHGTGGAAVLRESCRQPPGCERPTTSLSGGTTTPDHVARISVRSSIDRIRGGGSRSVPYEQQASEARH